MTNPTTYSVARVKVSPGTYVLQYRVRTPNVTGKPLNLAWFDFANVGENFKSGLMVARSEFLKNNPQYFAKEKDSFTHLITHFTPRQRKDKSVDRPPYVLGCLDHPSYNDRYTVYLGGEFLTATRNDEVRTRMNTNVAYLAMNGAPTHPLGFSQFGESAWFELDDYMREHRKFVISWDDLPEKVRKHVRDRCE